MVDGFLDRVLDAGAFEFGDRERDAVDEQHGIRDDVAAPAAQLHLELVDDEEIVVVRVLEVDEPDRLRAAVVPVRQAVHHGALEQQFRGRLIHLHQAMAGGLLQVADGAADPGVVQPRLAVA